ncbi:MAG: sodium:alanine symporter family protein [Clostridia bacterium]|nr:sodium:alanine symporter family protein [Clostridia bacterium]
MIDLFYFVKEYLDLIMVTLLVCTGLFLTVRLGFFQFRKFGYANKHTIGSVFSKKTHEKDASGVTSFQAVATAMAGTIGTGSIAGVATAIVAGGPGAVFWMWMSALLGMVTKYSEIVLSLYYREKNDKGEWVGGPMYYIKNGLGIKWLAAAFALFAMIACLGTGNATQSNSIALALESTLKIKPWITGLVLTAIVAFVILGGVKRIASVNEKMVPLMAVFFVVCAIVALCMNIGEVPAAFKLIFKEAFNFKSAAGGVAGYGIMKAMQAGFTRSVFSNEAGLGSAPIAHAASTTKDPVKQGLWGLFEVFFTTIIICTISALIIITTGSFITTDSGVDGAVLSINAFNSIMPGIGGGIVTLSTVFFALSTILGWAYYGEVSTQYLFKKQKHCVTVYRIVYVAFVFIGAVLELGVVWDVSVFMNTLMAVPNLVGIIGLYKVVAKITKAHFKKDTLE